MARFTFFIINGNCEGCPVWLSILGNHERDLELIQPFSSYWQADQTTAEDLARSSSSSYLECRTKNANFSVVANWAGSIKSPSFSRDSSSMTTRNSPFSTSGKRPPTNEGQTVGFNCVFYGVEKTIWKIVGDRAHARARSADKVTCKRLMITSPLEDFGQNCGTFGLEHLIG